MSGATVRLLGPDLPNALVLDNLSVDLSVLELKQRALAQLPPSERCTFAWLWGA